jgi:hypothetical protein
MRHATFTVPGQFTTDNSGHAVAYTTGGRHGWGAIKARANGNIGPSGQPIGPNRIGLSYDFGLVGGKLKTADCPTNEPIASCGSDHIDKLWTWTGHDFTRRDPSRPRLSPGARRSPGRTRAPRRCGRRA